MNNKKREVRFRGFFLQETSFKINREQKVHVDREGRDEKQIKRSARKCCIRPALIPDKSWSALSTAQEGKDVTRDMKADSNEVCIRFFSGGKKFGTGVRD